MALQALAGRLLMAAGFTVVRVGVGIAVARFMTRQRSQVSIVEHMEALRDRLAGMERGDAELERAVVQLNDLIAEAKRAGMR